MERCEVDGEKKIKCLLCEQPHYFSNLSSTGVLKSHVFSKHNDLAQVQIAIREAPPKTPRKPRTYPPEPAALALTIAPHPTFVPATPQAVPAVQTVQAVQAAPDMASLPPTVRELYPPHEPWAVHKLKVSDVHELYVEHSGNPNGQPAVVLHGGPGGGCAPFYRQFFDPKDYHIIMFDQRGSGKSEPLGSLEENTTWHLVEDIEKLRKHVNVDRWVVFGGSWGSTLALAYAEKYPERVKALVLRGIFMLRRKELLWFYQEGANFLFADAFDKYVAAIPPGERGDLMSAYYRRLTGNDREEQLKAARVWTTWEMSTSRLYVDPETVAKGEDDAFALTFARIESHYFVHGGFFERDGQLLDEAFKLAGVPGTIVQGRYDVVCPFISAWELHKAWPNSNLQIVPDAGHSAKEPGIVSELVQATDRYKHVK